MSSPQTHIPKALNPNPQIVDNNPLSSKTPEKPPPFHRRARTYNVALSVEQIRRSAAKSLFNSPQKQSTDEIDAWPAEIPKKKTRVRRSVKLPEKYEILEEFFNCLDFSIRRLKKRSLKSSFTNICSTIEYLTNRKFTYGHLAQLKFVLPEVIEIKKVLFLDEKTRLMKPDLYVSMNVGALGDNDGKVISEGSVIMHLRRAFRKRLADISKSHPEDYEIPEETLPHPFNTAKQQMNSESVKVPSSSSAGKVLTGVHAVEQSGVSTIFHEGKEIRDEMHPSPSDQLMEDLNSDNNETHKRLVSMKTSFEVLPKEQQPAIAAYLSRSFQRHSSQEDAKAEVQAPSLSVPESNPSTVCFIQDINTAAASSYSHFPATPTKGISAIENDDSFPRRSASIEWTPEKLASNPSRLMTITPALHPPKRCYMSTDVHSASSPNKLVKRPPGSRSLKYNTPMKNKLLSSDDDSTSSSNKLVRHPSCSRSLKFDTPVKNKMLKEEALFLDRAAIFTDISGVLSEDLLQSIRDKERKAVEEQTAILRANRRLQIISGLPKLFNMIRFLFQSMTSSFMNKEDLVDKIVFSHSDSVDGGEVEEQLQLLLELVPGWISENLSLIKINRMSNPESVLARLEEAR